jgi:putative flippase GtrA
VKRTAASALADADVRRFARFVAVGVLNTLVGYAIYAVLIYVGLPPQRALAIAFFLGVIWNYVTHAKFVFGTRGYRRLPLYFAAYLIVYLGNAGGLEMLLRAGVSPLIAQALILPLAVVASFLLVGKALTGRWPVGEGRSSP